MNRSDTEDLQYTLGKTPIPLSQDWLNARGLLFQPPVPDTPDTQAHQNAPVREVFYLDELNGKHDGQPQQQIVILIRDQNGFYKTLCVDPNDRYDLALLSEDYESALDIAEQRLEDDPDNPEYLFDVAYALGALDRPEEAVSTYERVLAQEPSNACAWNNLGCELAAQGKTHEAHRAYKQAAALEPDSVSYNMNLHRSYVQRGEYEAGFEYFERAVRLPPNCAHDWAVKANLKNICGISSVEDVQNFKNKFLAEHTDAPKPDEPVFH